MGAKKEIIKYLDFKPDSRKDLEPHFLETFPSKGVQFNVIEGIITDAKIVTKDFAEETANRFIITIEDADGEIDIVEFSHCEATYSFISALASAVFSKPIKVSVRKQLNKDGFPFTKIDVSQGGLRIPWKEDVRAKLPEGVDRKAYFEDFFEKNIVCYFDDDKGF